MYNLKNIYSIIDAYKNGGIISAQKGAVIRPYDNSISANINRLKGKVREAIPESFRTILPGFSDIEDVAYVSDAFGSKGTIGDKVMSVAGLALPVVGGKALKEVVQNTPWKHVVENGQNFIMEGDKYKWVGQQAENFLKKINAKTLYTPISQNQFTDMLSNKGVLTSRVASNKTPVFLTKKKDKAPYWLEHSGIKSEDIIPGEILKTGYNSSDKYDVINKFKFDLFNDPSIKIYKGDKLLDLDEIDNLIRTSY